MNVDDFTIHLASGWAVRLGLNERRELVVRLRFSLDRDPTLADDSTLEPQEALALAHRLAELAKVSASRFPNLKHSIEIAPHVPPPAEPAPPPVPFVMTSKVVKHTDQDPPPWGVRGSKPKLPQEPPP